MENEDDFSGPSPKIAGLMLNPGFFRLRQKIL
jgi:hypothetical protein